MTVESLIQFVHVLCGVTFFGIAIASFMYISNSINQYNDVLLRYALKVSLLGDCIIFPVIVIQFITGFMMVRYYDLSFQTPWIIVAFIAFSAISVIWLLLFLIKYVNYFSASLSHFQYKKSFFILNIILLILFCTLIHDAIMRQTWFWR